MARPKNDKPQTRLTVNVPQDLYDKCEEDRWDKRLDWPAAYVTAALEAFADSDPEAAKAKVEAGK